MKILDEIIKRVHNLTLDQQKKVLEYLQSLQGEEQRDYKRLKTNVEIAVVIGNKVLQSDAQDISATGMYVKTTGKFETDKKVRVAFTVPGHDTPFKLQGKIARIDQKGLAIQFEKVSPYFKNILDDAIWKTKTV